MARPSYSTPTGHSRFAVPLVVALLVVLALAPRRVTGWVAGLRSLVLIPTAPLSQPLLSLSRSALQHSPEGTPRDEHTRELEEKLQTAEMYYRREHAENLQLREFIAELQKGIALNPNQPVLQAIAPVIGTSADTSSGLLTARAPANLAADRNTVATTTGLQLVGRVSSATGSLITLTPITLKSAGKIRGVIMTDDSSFSLASELSPKGDGTLRGIVRVLDSRVPAGTKPPEPMPGQIVRLDDADWPPAAMMLVLGKIESVSPSPEEAQRLMITVRPLVNVERVARVTLRFDEEAAGKGGGGGGGSGGGKR